MSCQIINGQSIAQKIYQETDQQILDLRARGINPKLGVILVGDNQNSLRYIKQKEVQAQARQIRFTLHHLPKNTTNDQLNQKIAELNQDPTYSGLIIQLPLPSHLNSYAAVNQLLPELDVDCLTALNLGRLIADQPLFIPPAAGAVITILDEIKAILRGANVTVIGTGILVGKPLIAMLVNALATVTTCNEHTTHLKNHCLGADIIVSATGQRGLLGADLVPPGAIVIDYGDARPDEIMAQASYFTPTPGGVGPITVARLLQNTVIAADRRHG